MNTLQSAIETLMTTPTKGKHELREEAYRAWQLKYNHYVDLCKKEDAPTIAGYDGERDIFIETEEEYIWKPKHLRYKDSVIPLEENDILLANKTYSDIAHFVLDSPKIFLHGIMSWRFPEGKQEANPEERLVRTGIFVEYSDAALFPINQDLPPINVTETLGGNLKELAALKLAAYMESSPHYIGLGYIHFRGYLL